jgi:hypothetical protein
MAAAPGRPPGTTALATLALWPLLAALVRRAVALSGSGALADLGIASFLFSPLGFLALLVVSAALIAILVVGTAAMMAIDMAERGESRPAPCRPCASWPGARRECCASVWP